MQTCFPMKTMFSVAGGILLAVLALAILDIVIGTSGAAAGFFAVLFADEEFQLTLLIIVAIAAAIGFGLINKRYTGRWF